MTQCELSEGKSGDFIQCPNEALYRIQIQSWDGVDNVSVCEKCLKFIPTYSLAKQ